MRIPPVLVLVAAVSLSVTAARIDPLASASVELQVLGALVAIVGSATALAGVLAFRHQRTTVDPRYPERASALVANGIDRWTRNPMYVGFVCVGIGAAVALGSLLALAGPAALALYLDRVQIPAEERALRERFGQSFHSYVLSVRRWFGRRN
jgi:protein-S-isoprenylcysteine O-methyltransferase Ste14